MTLEDDVARFTRGSSPGPVEQKFTLNLGVSGKGLPVDVMAEQLREFQEYTREVDASLTSPVSVFMDTSTVYTGFSLLNGRRSLVTPVGLLDLESFIRSVVLCDHIHVLPSTQATPSAINDRLGEPVVIPLPEYAGNRLRTGFLNAIWHDAQHVSRWTPDGAARDAAVIEEGWTDILGEPVPGAWSPPEPPVDPDQHPWQAVRQTIIERLRVRKATTTRPAFPTGARSIELPPEEKINWERVDKDGHRFGSDAPVMTERMSFAIRSGFRDVRVLRIVHESNARSAFNSLLANTLGLPYVPGLARMPMYHHMADGSITLHTQLQDSVRLRALLRRHDIVDDALVPVPRRLTELPVFIGIFLRQVSDIDDAWNVLRDLRLRATPYRRRRAEVLHNLTQGSREGERAFDAAVEADSRLWRQAGWAFASSTAAVAGAFGGGIYGPAIATLGALVAADRLDRDTRQALVRRFRPHEWYLTSVAAAADGALRDVAKVERIWKTELSPKFLDDLQRIRDSPRLRAP